MDNRWRFGEEGGVELEDGLLAGKESDSGNMSVINDSAMLHGATTLFLLRAQESTTTMASVRGAIADRKRKVERGRGRGGCIWFGEQFLKGLGGQKGRRCCCCC